MDEEAHRTYGRDEEHILTLAENHEIRRPLKKLSVDGRILTY
jgi:hypothetical protein